MSLMRTRTTTSPSVLLMAAMLAIMSVCQLATRHAEAGGKGKGGRQGHIIVQNEVKANSVPIYMPIPIPIPVPMGAAPAQPPPPPHGNRHYGQHGHQHQHHGDGEGEGEVKKIYLLQPMPRAQPQPHLKGGGYMGAPVQNHIHVGPVSPGKYRHSGAGQKTFADGADQQHEHQHQQQAKSAPGVPIVMILPIAPMPPVQHPHSTSSQAPQYNNYVVAPAPFHGRRRSPMGHGARHGGGVESFSDYGGSLGASVFRDQYARSHLGRGRNFRSTSQTQGDAGDEGDLGSGSQQRAWRSMRPDYDYADYGDHADATSSSLSGLRGSFQLSDLAEQPRDSPWLAQARRRHQTVSGSPSGLSSRYNEPRRHHQVKSIRDIMESSTNRNHHHQQQQQQQFYDDDPGDFDTQQSRYSRQQRQQPLSDMDTTPTEQVAGSRQLAGKMEISLDELNLLTRDNQQQQQQQKGRGGQDLGSLYYDRGDSSPLVDNQSRNSAGSGAARTRSSSWPTTSGSYRLPRPDERDLFNDHDEWRLDSVKSVSHAAANETSTESSGSAPEALGKVLARALVESQRSQPEDLTMQTQYNYQLLLPGTSTNSSTTTTNNNSNSNSNSNSNTNQHQTAKPPSTRHSKPTATTTTTTSSTNTNTTKPDKASNPM